MSASEDPGTPAMTSHDQLEEIAAGLRAAAPAWAAMPPSERANALMAVADALAADGEALISIAMIETGLSSGRLTGELARTVVQLRLFAEVVLDGSFLDVRIDEEDPDFALGVRPDLRRFNVPVGPVLNFAASNFPFAFSVAGGDSVAALAAGCPVVVKAHPGHPVLSVRTAQIVARALERAGAPRGLFALIQGQDDGVAMLRHPAIAAASFTGSLAAGRLLADVAARRPQPIPFYGELGSVNPVFATADALVERSEAIVEGFIASISGSAGQLCTKPGFLFLPAGHGLADGLRALAEKQEAQRLLNPGTSERYRERRDSVLATAGVTVISRGSLRIDEAGEGWATPTIVSVSLDGLTSHRESLLEEAFGPLSIVVEFDSVATLVTAVHGLFDGSLTGTIHLGEHEDSSWLRELTARLGSISGRTLINGWPTGVAVTPAMHHGGPWPTSTAPSSTSVGSAAIERFLRPIAYQNMPQRMLPAPLRDDNPWGVPQTRNRAGFSKLWGFGSGQLSTQTDQTRTSNNA